MPGVGRGKHTSIATADTSLSVERRKPRQGMKIRVTEILNPSSFYAQLGSEDELAEFDRFMAEMALLCEEKGVGAKFVPPVGTFVAVKRPGTATTGQEQWIRAMVTRHISDCELECQLIDIGITERVSCMNVCQQSPSQLCNLAAQALSCSLKDAGKLSGDDCWSKEAIDMFTELVADPSELDVTVHDRIGTTWMLTVFTRKGRPGWTSVAFVLAEAGLGLFSPGGDSEHSSSTALVVSQSEASAHRQSVGADPIALQGGEANAELCKQELSQSPAEPLGSAPPEPVINTASASVTDVERVVHEDGDIEKSVTILCENAAASLNLNEVEFELNKYTGNVKDDSQAIEDERSQRSDSTEKEKFLSDGVVSDEKGGDRLSTPTALSPPVFEGAKVEKESQHDTTSEHTSREHALCVGSSSAVCGEADKSGSDGDTNGLQGRENDLPVVGSLLKPFPVTVENSSDEDSDQWDESLLQPSLNRRNRLPFSSRQEQQSSNMERKQACFNAFMSERNDSSHYQGNPPFHPKRAVNRHHYRGANRFPIKSRYQIPPCIHQINHPGQQQSSSGMYPSSGGRGRGSLARYPKGYLHSQPMSFGQGKNSERVSNFRPFSDTAPPRGSGVQTSQPAVSQSGLASRKPFPGSRSFPRDTEHRPVSGFSTPDGDPMTSSSTRRIPGITGETLKAEMDWHVWKIKQDLKKALLCIANPEHFFTEVQKIAVGTSAQKLYALRNPMGPLGVILKELVMYGVDHPEHLDELSRSLQCALSDAGARQSFKPAFEEVAKDLCQTLDPPGIQGRCAVFCSLLGKLWLLAVSQNSDDLLAVVGPVVKGFLDKWAHLSPEAPASVLITSAQCFAAICSEIGSVLDYSERESLDDYFNKVVKENIFSDKFPRLAKEVFFNIYFKRTVWLLQNQSSHSVESKPGFRDLHSRVEQPHSVAQSQQEATLHSSSVGINQSQYSQIRSQGQFGVNSQPQPQLQSIYTSFSPTHHPVEMTTFTQLQPTVQTIQQSSFDQPYPDQSLHQSSLHQPQSSLSQGQSSLKQPQSGLTQRHSGLSQPQLGPSQPQLGLNQPQLGLNQPQLGPSQPQLGPSQPQLGLNQPQLGLSQLQSGLSQPQLSLSQPYPGLNQPQSEPTSNQPQSSFNQPQSSFSQPQSNFSQPPSRLKSGIDQSGASQYWQPVNQSAFSQPNAGCGLLDSSEPQVGIIASKFLKSQSIVSQASLPQSQLGVGQAGFYQPGVSQAMLTQSQSGVSQAMFLQPQPSVSQSVFSQPQPSANQAFFVHSQPSQDRLSTSQLSDSNDMQPWTEAGAALATFFHQARFSQPNADQAISTRSGTNQSVPFHPGTGLSTLSEYHSGVNEKSSSYFQQLQHRPQSHALLSECHAQANLPGMAAETDPISVNCATHSTQSRLASQTPGPLPLDTNKQVPPMQIVGAPVDMAESQCSLQFAYMGGAQQSASMPYTDVSHQHRPSQQLLQSQGFLYNQDSLESPHDILSQPRYATQQRRHSASDANSRQGLVHQEFVNPEAHSQTFVPHSPFPSSRAQEFPTVPLRADSMQLPSAEASPYPWPKLSPQSPVQDSPKFSSQSSSFPGMFEQAATDVQQTQPLPHYQLQQAQSVTPTAVQQQVPQSLTIPIQRTESSYIRTKHVLLPSSNNSRTGVAPQRDVSVGHNPAVLQDIGSSESGCTHCGSKFHHSQVCSQQLLINN